MRPGCVTWSSVPEPEPAALRDPDTGKQGIRLEFRTEDGKLAGTEHRTATMFTWWDGLPAGIGWGGRGTIVLADQVAAIGYCWLPGQAMGDALGDVLLGHAEPGGRLPVTIPVAEADCPVLHSVPDQGRLDYIEGLLIGYRGYDQAGTAPRFAFGHGLGYTTWEYQSAVAESVGVGPDLKTADLELTVTIRNAGTRPGRGVVQAYVEPVAAEAGRPVRTWPPSPPRPPSPARPLRYGCALQDRCLSRAHAQVKAPMAVVGEHRGGSLDLTR